MASGGQFVVAPDSRRGTPAKAGGIGRIDDAYELFFFRPRREFRALVAIAEHIVLQALWRSISA